MAGEDGLGFGGVEVGEEALGEFRVRGVAEDGGGVVGGDLDLGRGFDDLQAAVGGEDVGAVDEAGVGFAELELGGYLTDVGFEGDDVLEDGVVETGLAGGRGVEVKHLAGVGAGGDGLGGHDDATTGLCQILDAGYAGGVADGYGQHEGVGSDDGRVCLEEAGALEGVEVVGVGGDDEVGAGAGFDLEAEDLGAGEVGDDLDSWVVGLEGVGGFGEGFAEGGGSEDVEVLGGGGVAGGEEKGCQEGLGGVGCARKSFFQKTLEVRRGALAERVGVVGQRAVGLAGGGWRSRGTDLWWGRVGE